MAKFEIDPFCGFSKSDFEILIKRAPGSYPKTEASIRSKYPKLTAEEITIFAKLVNSTVRDTFTAYDATNYFKKLNDSRVK